MATNQPTRILTEWLAADREEAARLLRSIEGDDYGDIRGGVEDYVTNHADEAPAAELFAWGAAQGLAHGSRQNLVRTICDHIDWQYFATHLSARDSDEAPGS